MATEKICLGINLRKNKNSQIVTSFGKYYPEVDVQKTLSLRGFAEHMSGHQSFYSRDVVEGVLHQVVKCLPELLSQGIPVKLGSLGTFYPTAEVVEGTSITSVEDMAGLNPNDIVKAIHIRFLPDATKLDNLCGPAFKDACSLELRNIVDTKELTIKGKKRKVQTLLPIETAVAEWKAEHPESTSSSTTPSGGDNGGSQNSGDSGSSSSSGSENQSGSQNQGGSSSSSVASPTISGTTPFDDSTQVTIAAAEGASIKYTTNGVAPTATYGNDYEEPITLNASATVKAVAIIDGVASEVASKAFVKNGSQGGGSEEGM